MSELIFVNVGGQNAGDKYCCPNRYYKFNIPNQHITFRQFEQHTNSPKSKIYIVGGGGILNTSISNNKLYKRLKDHHKYILWGAGFNKVLLENIKFQCPDNCKNPEIDKLEKFDLIGRRDYGDFVGEYIPCSSCKLDGLSKKYVIKRRVGVVKHMSQHTIGDPGDASINMMLKRMKKGSDSLKELLEFIGSSEIIVTSSYHGMYWATLMNKRVIIQKPCSNKFLYFKYPPVTYSGNLEKDIEKTQIYENSLQECVDLNDKFYNKILGTI